MKTPRAGQPASEAVLEMVVKALGPRGLVSVAPATPALIKRFSGPVVSLCPRRDLPAVEARYWVEHDTGPIDPVTAALLLNQVGADRGKLDLAWVDGHHALTSLLSQLSFLFRLNPDMRLVLDDAVPPDMGMTGVEHGAEDWWVGEVWALVAWLRRVSPTSVRSVYDSWPTGLAVIEDVDPRLLETADPADIRAALADLTTLRAVRIALECEPLGLVEASTARFEVSPACFVTLGALTAVPEAQVTILDVETPFVRPAAVLVADLSDQGVPQAFHGPVEIVSSSKARVVLPAGAAVRGSALVHLPGGRLIFPRNAGQLDTEGFADYIRANQDPSRPDTGFHAGLRWTGSTPGLTRAEAVEIPGDVLWATADEPFNYGVWLLQTLPTIVAAERDGFDGALLCHAPMVWQKRLIEYFAPRLAQRWVEHELQYAYRAGGRLHLTMQNRRNFVITPSEREIFDEIVARTLAHRHDPTPERIFVSRLNRSRANPTYRALINEEALIAGLEADGFVAVEPESLSFSAQIALFAQARYIVGLGGAGLFNAAFCRPGATITTLEGSNLWVEAHANIFASRGLDYGVVFGRQMMEDEGPQKRWSLPIEQALAAIRQADPTLR
jgi:capsular polysaccharide biosynthesis protein